MSSIKSTQVDGDVSVSRNAAIGGDVTIQGKTHLKGNVKVEGWLEAKNIQSANKGLFTTIEKLKIAHPFPHNGWWALVGTTLPAPIYVGDGGEWVPTGEEGGTPSVDDGKYNEIVEKFQNDITQLQNDVTEIGERNESYADSVNSLQERMDAVEDTVDEASNKADNAGEQLNAFKATKGANGGIAPLDDDGKVSSKHLPAYVDDVLEFNDIVIGITAIVESIDKSSEDEGCNIVYDKERNCFILSYLSVVEEREQITTYYGNWRDAENFGTLSDNGRIPYSGKVFLCKEDGKSYRWSGTQLASIGSDLALGHTSATAFPGDEGARLQEKMAQATQDITDNENALITQNKQIVARGIVNANKLFGLADKKVTFSVVLEKCATSEYAEVLQIPGIILTFFTESGWLSKQWTNTSDWNDESNWTDFGADSDIIGKDAVLLVDEIAPLSNGYYTLETAIAAIVSCQQETGVTYERTGLIITYKTGEYEMETRQFQGAVSDFNEVALWKNFGGEGSKVELGDAPEEGGDKALSTGGAYDCIPVDFSLDTETEGVVKIQMVNAKGEGVGEEKQFLVGTGGGGGGGGTIVAIAFESSPVYGAYGSPIKGRAAVRSVTSGGGIETENSIETLEIVDRDSGLTVWTERVNRPSSGDLTDYTFELDFTSFFTAAGSRKFKLVATDDSGNTGSKNISVTAVDITCTCVQVLQYSPDTPVTPTTGSVTIPLYKFANNQSDKGISVRVDIKINGEWHLLATTAVNDSFTHSITLHPSELGLSHGSYPLRIQGTDIASGAKGNTIYTAVMVVEEGNETPIVSLRYDDTTGGTVRLYDTLKLDVAVYVPGKLQSHVAIFANGIQFTQLLALNTRSYSVSQQIKGYADGTAVTYNAIVSAVSSDNIIVTVDGSAIDAELTSGTIYDFDFSGRSNDEADHSITSNGYELKLAGANFTSNGFGTFLGKNCLRIAENVTGQLNHYMFGSSMLEATGGAIQFTFATKNVKDKNAKLMECYDESSGAGFYVTGSKVGIYCKNGIRSREERSYEQGKEITAAIVVEPTSIYIERGGIKYSMICLYLDGERVAALGYVGGTGNLFQDRNIKFNGEKGDLYLYNLCAWNTYFEWAQAHKNYLVRLTDTEIMVKEYEFENVLVSQTAEGTTMLRPSAAELYARGIPYIVEVASDESFNEFDNGVSTSDNFTVDLYYYDPVHPWCSFVARGVRKRRQGTTSAKRCKKNPRYYLGKAKEIVPLFPDYTNADALLSYALFKQKKVRVGENTIPVDIITVKIDFSDSSGVNDCGTCDMMNYTYRSLGGDYLTPAQRFFDGTYDLGDIHIEGLEMNHSTANHPVCVFRSTSDTLQNVYFEARGNWKEDKGEQTALGFMNTPGYNLGCLNYQDASFVEFFGRAEETLDQIEERFKATDGLDTGMLYLLSLYCGRDYRFMRYVDGAWKDTTGSMYQEGGKWLIEGDVLNPVEGFELLVYQGMCWWRGVSSVEDMMKPSSMKSSWVQKLIDKGEISGDTFPAWTYYFECMVDNDQLAIDYALGKKVPYQLYDMLRFCNTCNKDNDARWQENWRNNLRLHANPKSVMSYYGFTDYACGKDQQAKNMQPMWFLESGASVTKGVYSPNALIMYLNKIYDADGVNDKDNDGGCDTDPEVDPGKPSTDTYTNPFAGWNSILWVCCREQQEVLLVDGNTIDLRTVIAAMRSCQIEVDGQMMKPFSPDGAIYFYCTKRQLVWPKVVSSYDGYRKYIQYTATSDAIYFYALQGLGLTSLPAFIRTRWRIRDGYYQTGDFFSGVLSGRIACGADATITIMAAATGYFGVGNDASGNLSESCYLEAGQSYTFTNFAKDEGALLYIYQADRMSSIDLSALTLSDNFDFSVMSLVETLVTGGENHVERSMGYNKLAAYMLGDLPFLTTLDIRNTGAKSLDASKCPRIEHIHTEGSVLENLTLAETSPINDISLPATMTSIRFVGLPELTYTGLSASSGLQIESMPNVQRLRLETSPKLDAIQMLRDVLASQMESCKLSMLRISNMTLKADGSELLAILEYGVAGMDEDGNRQDKPVVNGTYELTVIRETDEIESLESGIDGLVILTVIDAYIDLINWFNNESYGGEPYYDNVTLDNINEVLEYYNGETYKEYLERFAEDNMDINDLINK